MTVVRRETEALPDGELLIELNEDQGQAPKIMLTLMGKEVALGRANLAQVFRKLTRSRAESLIDAILGVVRQPDEVSADGAIRARLEAEKAGKQKNEKGVALPVPVKARGANPTESGVELDVFGRKDLADKLRALADSIEVRDEKVLIVSCEIEPIRGGGQSISLRTVRRP